MNYMSTVEQELSEVKNRLKRLEMENKDLSFKLQNKTKEVEGLQEENKNLETNLSKMNKGMISDLITDLNAQLTGRRTRTERELDHV